MFLPVDDDCFFTVQADNQFSKKKKVSANRIETLMPRRLVRLLYACAISGLFQDSARQVKWETANALPFIKEGLDIHANVVYSK